MAAFRKKNKSKKESYLALARKSFLEQFKSDSSEKEPEQIKRIADSFGSDSLPLPETNPNLVRWHKGSHKTPEKKIPQKLLEYLKYLDKEQTFYPGMRYENAKRVLTAGGQACQRKELHFAAGYLIYCQGQGGGALVEVMPWAWNYYQGMLLDVSITQQLLYPVYNLAGSGTREGENITDPQELGRILLGSSCFSLGVEHRITYYKPENNLFYFGVITDYASALALVDFWIKENVDKFDWFNTTKNALTLASLGAMASLGQQDKKDKNGTALQNESEDPVQDLSHSYCNRPSDGSSPEEE